MKQTLEQLRLRQGEEVMIMVKLINVGATNSDETDLLIGDEPVTMVDSLDLLDAYNAAEEWQEQNVDGG